MNQAYWARNPQGPFATLIAVAATYCHPEAYDGPMRTSLARARSAAPDDEEIRVFRDELREALADPVGCPMTSCSRPSDYGDGSNQAFLRRLWRDLYGDEPAAGA